jgi:hypothetical protein
MPAVLFGHQIAQVFTLGMRFHFRSAGLRPGAVIIFFLSRRAGGRRSAHAFATN